MSRAIVLFSGGLDCMLAARLLQDQGFEVEGLNFRTVFTCCQALAGQAAAELGIQLTVAEVDDRYLQLIREPEYGYGRGLNPCIDCRIYMFRLARTMMEETGADLVISGEVVGQRPMSQKRRDLDIIARESGLQDHLLRPLSAKLLEPTLPERNGLVDREALCDISGRSRYRQIAMAREFGFRLVPDPSTGCALTEPGFSKRVGDLIKFHPQATRWDFELLNTGRHLRYDRHTKVVVGRNAEENEVLAASFGRSEASPSAMLIPENFSGPTALIVGRIGEETIRFATGLMLRFSRRHQDGDARIRVEHDGTVEVIRGHADPAAQTVSTL